MTLSVSKLVLAGMSTVLMGLPFIGYAAGKSDLRALVVFFSHTGENYGVGNIKVGNTHKAADLIATATKAKTFEIVPTKPYPKDSYNAVVDIAKKEQSEKARPEIKSDIDISDYDVIFIGYPNWWGDMPMAVYTFIEKHDWTGKTVVPFCTHEGSGLSGTDKTLSRICKGATVAKGLAIRGTTAQNDAAQTAKAIDAWLKSLDLL